MPPRFSCLVAALVAIPGVVHPQAKAAQPQSGSWRVDKVLLLDLGGADDVGPTQFSRILGLMRLSDGTIVVADDGSSELRYFDAQGKHLKTTAGKGSGPGEVRGFDGAAAVGDTVYAYGGLGSIEVFDHQGKFVRQVQLRDPAGTRRLLRGPPHGVVRGGRFVGIRYVARPLTEWPEYEEVAIADRGAAHVETLGRIANFKTFLVASDPGRRILGFSPQPVIVTFPDEVCTGYTARYDIQCVDTVGRPTRHISRDVMPVRVAEQMRRALAWDVSGRLPDGGSKYEGSLRVHRENEASTMQYASVLPAFARAVAAQTGDLWVSDYRPEDGLRSFGHRAPALVSQWRVYGRRGESVGTVALPPSFFLYDAGPNWVLGVTWDADDVEHVTLLRLRR